MRLLKQMSLAGARFLLFGHAAAEFFVGATEGDAAAGGASEVAFLDEIGLVVVFNRVAFFGEGSGEGFDADGAAVELTDKRGEKGLVALLQTVAIDAFAA